MGTGKRWSNQERLHLTEAWVDATEDAGEVEVKGTYQDSDVFWQRVYDKYTAKAPPNYEKGSYNGRQVTAVKNQWKDKISREVKKFNKALLRVFNARPTGCTEQNKINMAVAIQIGKTSTMSYIHKEFEANDWEYYQCWQVLKPHRAFLPPPLPTEENTVEMIDEEKDGQTVASTSTDSLLDSVSTTAPTNVAVVAPVPSKGRSRGPGPGSKKTKANAINDEYKQKKAKIQEGFLEVQQQRQQDFNAFVKNHARNKAFEMAALGYKTFKDSDPEEAAKYKFHMSNIINGNTVGDEQETTVEMPSLTSQNVHQA